MMTSVFFSFRGCPWCLFGSVPPFVELELVDFSDEEVGPQKLLEQQLSQPKVDNTPTFTPDHSNIDLQVGRLSPEDSCSHVSMYSQARDCHQDSNLVLILHCSMPLNLWLKCVLKDTRSLFLLVAHQRLLDWQFHWHLQLRQWCIWHSLTLFYIPRHSVLFQMPWVELLVARLFSVGCEVTLISFETWYSRDDMIYVLGNHPNTTAISIFGAHLHTLITKSTMGSFCLCLSAPGSWSYLQKLVDLPGGNFPF